MGKDTPYTLVCYLEQAIKKKTGIMPNLVRGTSRMKELGSAKKLLKRVDGAMARRIIDLWAEDEWNVKNAPTMAFVYSKASELIFKLEMADVKKEREGKEEKDGYIRRHRGGRVTL